MKKFRGCLSVFAIFMFGVIVGVVITTGVIREKVYHLVERGPDSVVDVVVNHLKDNLKLDSEQQEMLHQIALETKIQLATIRQQTQPQVTRTLDDATVRVRAILNPEQARKFDEIIKRARADRRNARVLSATSSPAPATPADDTRSVTPEKRTDSDKPSEMKSPEAKGEQNPDSNTKDSVAPIEQQ
jgi:hypothetical protein